MCVAQITEMHIYVVFGVQCHTVHSVFDVITGVEHTPSPFT